MTVPSTTLHSTDSPLASLRGNHVAVRVADFAEALRFYTDKLDFRVVQEWRSGPMTLAYLAPANDDGFVIEILGGGSPTSSPAQGDLAASMQHAGYHHLCFVVDDVDATVVELRRRGVAIVREPVDLEVIHRRLAFIADPWGNLIEFAQAMR